MATSTLETAGWVSRVIAALTAATSFAVALAVMVAVAGGPAVAYENVPRGTGQWSGLAAIPVLTCYVLNTDDEALFLQNVIHGGSVGQPVQWTRNAIAVATSLPRSDLPELCTTAAARSTGLPAPNAPLQVVDLR